MKDLQLVGGDLLPAGRGFALVDGSAYLRQRIAMALAEPYGSDPFHPQWGSTLSALVGQPERPGTDALVSSEAARVLQQIIDAQQQQLNRTALTGARSQFRAADIITAVDSVNASPAAGDPQTMLLSMSLTTAAQDQIHITRTVSSA